MKNEKPIILEEGKNKLADIKTLRAKNSISQIKDLYESQSREFFAISHPQLIPSSSAYQKKFSEFSRERNGGKSTDGFLGNWIYFPWNKTLLHTVNEDEYTALRTNRNKNLITEEEQKKLYSGVIGIVGLSVGNSLALSLQYSGIGKTMKLAEHDTLDTTNLNRIRASLADIGIPKIKVTARQIYEINPYAELSLFASGLTKETLDQYIQGGKKLNLIFEAIDDFPMKVLLRQEARAAGVPVVMLTSLGDNILIDVERYDLDQKLPLFNGLAGNTPEEILQKPITEEDRQKYAVQIVGIENIPKRAMDSVSQIGKTLSGRPQLASSVTIAGGAAAYIARKVLLEKSAPSGRTVIKMDDII